MMGSRLPVVLGVLGLLPFVLGVIASQSNNSAVAHHGLILFLIYSFAIFNFLAGSLWGLSLANAKAKPLKSSCGATLLVNKGFLLSNALMLAVFFALAFVLLIMPTHLYALIVILATGYVFVLFCEYQWIWPAHNLPIEYARLRCLLTTCVVMLHVVLAMLIVL